MLGALIASSVSVDVTQVERLAGFDQLTAARTADTACCDLTRDNLPQPPVRLAVASSDGAAYPQCTGSADPFGIVHVLEESCRSRRTLSDEALIGEGYSDSEGVGSECSAVAPPPA